MHDHNTGDPIGTGHIHYYPPYRRRRVINNFYYAVPEIEDPPAEEKNGCTCGKKKRRWGRMLIGALAIIGLLSLLGGSLIKG